MSAWAFALVVFGAQLVGWALGRLVRRRLPPEHLDARTRDSVMLLVGMVATLSALVLGLMISTAKQSFDDDKAAVVEIAADVLLIDHALAAYGDGSKAARDLLRGFMQRAIDGVVSPDKTRESSNAAGTPLPPLPELGGLQKSLLALSPATEA